MYPVRTHEGNSGIKLQYSLNIIKSLRVLFLYLIMNMRIVLSPAKSLDWTSAYPKRTYTTPRYIPQAEKLIDVLKTYDVKGISNLMDISPALSQLNVERYSQWKADHSKRTRPAMYAFDGDVYTGLDAYTMEKKEVDFAQKHIRILSGLYGVLQPLDKIHPYRLEMGTTLPVEDKRNLYQYWGSTVVDQLNQELTEKDYLINLASEEYFKVIPTKELKAKLLTPVFYDYKNGQYKIISFFAKKARGLMARYIVDNRIKKIADIKGFDTDGYSFNEAMSKGNTWVFTRG